MGCLEISFICAELYYAWKKKIYIYIYEHTHVYAVYVKMNKST